jgi:hypothetical protein
MKRLGRFKISLDLINESSWITQRVMSQCIIVRAELLYTTHVVEYEAISYRFDLVEEGQTIPNYYWKFSPETDIEAIKI